MVGRGGVIFLPRLFKTRPRPLPYVVEILKKRLGDMPVKEGNDDR